jgi:hypothetical protein
MLIEYVLSACNNNPLYEEFIPIFIRAWKKVIPEAKIQIIYINTHIPSHLEEYSDQLVLFKPPAGISTSFISQYIRLLYPCILPSENGVLITDIDMIPMNRRYYVYNIKDIPNDKFVYYRNVLLDMKMIAMYYNVAAPATWRELFGMTSVHTIQAELIRKYGRIRYDARPGGYGWSTDQLDLYNKVIGWNCLTNRFICLDDKEAGYERLCRLKIIIPATTSASISASTSASTSACELAPETETQLLTIMEQTKSNYYSDYHMLRPYSKFKEINDRIVDAINQT